MQLTAHESCDTQRQSCDQINLGDSIKQITQSIEPKKKNGDQMRATLDKTNQKHNR